MAVVDLFMNDTVSVAHNADFDQHNVRKVSTNLRWHESLLLPLLAKRRDVSIDILTDLPLQSPMGLVIVGTIVPIEP